MGMRSRGLGGGGVAWLAAPLGPDPDVTQCRRHTRHPELPTQTSLYRQEKGREEEEGTTEMM